METVQNMIKTEEEISKIKTAQAITHKVFLGALAKIKAGITELELVAEINADFIKSGAEETAFDTIVAFGGNTADVHHVPTDRELAKNELVMIDLGAKKDGYCSDMTRTFCYGAPSTEITKVYNAVLEAQQRTLRYLKAGMTGKEADAIAREYLRACGYDKEFCHTLGHGVGVVVHEQPRLANYCDEVLAENMVVTVEPGVYIEGFGGVRIEDMVVIKKDGIENLTECDKKLIIQKD